MPPSPQTTRLQSTLRLLIPRLRLLQKKDTASSVAQRRELAQLLDNGREASARIRVENVIANDIAVEVMEMIELYCELLLARATVLDQIAFSEKGARARSKARETVKAESGATESRGLGLGFSRSFGRSTDQKQDDPAKSKQTESTAGEQEEEGEFYIDPGLDEAAAAIFYAWPRFPREVRELTTLRSLLVDRWGRDFAALAQDNKAAVKVPERLVKRLRVRPPPPELVESYLREIAKAYGVAWPKEEATAEDKKETLDKPPDYPGDGDVAEGDESQRQQRESPSTPQKANLAEIRRASEADELSRVTPPRDIGPHDVTGRSPVSVAPPGPSSDNPNPRVKIPGEQNAAATVQPASPPRKDSKGIPDVDELARRFAALKR
ncbi:hypothetical protein VTN96DRAFT_7321 [Rasamsonia emersonii]